MAMCIAASLSQKTQTGKETGTQISDRMRVNQVNYATTLLRARYSASTEYKKQQVSS